jgi:hypothetical protein
MFPHQIILIKECSLKTLRLTQTNFAAINQKLLQYNSPSSYSSVKNTGLFVGRSASSAVTVCAQSDWGGEGKLRSKRILNNYQPNVVNNKSRRSLVTP